MTFLFAAMTEERFLKKLGNTATRCAVAAVLLLASPGMAQDPKPDLRTPRVWTNISGQQITAEYLGIRGMEVALRIAGGKVSFVPMANLSAADIAFVKENRLDYHEEWRAWPSSAGQAMQSILVKEEAGKQGKFSYTTQHFRFECDVNLGPTLMQDLARTFELTYRLHEKSPFGILAKPQNGLYEARLLTTLDDYQKAGGPVNSAGVYLSRQKVFLAPLELMGVRPSSAGYRKVTDEYDVSTIVHELTHMLTHDMLDNLPIWTNEGYAEYIATIPIEAKSFQTTNEKIREGVRNVFVTDHLRSITPRGEELPKWNKVERNKYLLGGGIRPLRKVADVLQMSDEEWTTGPRRPGRGLPGPAATAIRSPYSSPEPADRMARLYRTSHLIIYYFIQIEGEKGVTKIRRFLEENRRNMDRYDRYLEEFKAYQTAMENFMKLPGVTALPDGRFKYPAHLNPPKAPEAPFRDASALKLGGLSTLLEGETAPVVGERIEEALRQDLGIKLTFE